MSATTPPPGAGTVTLTLTDDEAKIVHESLSYEWDLQAKATAEEVNQGCGDHNHRDMRFADAAWKVRRQATIVGVLERLGLER